MSTSNLLLKFYANRERNRFMKLKNLKLEVILLGSCFLITLTLFSGIVIAEPPNELPIADADGPFTVIDPNTGEPYPFGFYIEFEGSEVNFDGLGSYDPRGGNIIFYYWSFFGSEGPPWIEQFYLTGPSPSKTWDDPFTSLINLRVFDDEHSFIGGQQSFGDDLAYLVVLDVIIDIKPGSYPNSINLKSKGVISVALLNENYFIPEDVVISTVSFGHSGVEAQPVHWAYEDIDNDQDIDLILHFKTQHAGFQEGDIEGILIAYLTNGKRIHAEDSIQIVPSKN